MPIKKSLFFRVRDDNYKNTILKGSSDAHLPQVDMIL